MTENTGGVSYSSGSDWQKYQTDYRKRHPEKVHQWNLNKAANLLRRNGYTVTPPETLETVKEGATE